jgi:hypothetical protein
MWFYDEIQEKARQAIRGVRMDIITPRSMKGARKATETIACYFRREFGYDFVQYSSEEQTDTRDRVILLTQNRYETKSAIGVICFRWRKYSNAPEGLALAWLWIHPYLRNRGILSAYWPIFREAYGAFHVEPPLSSAMKGLLRKMGECPRCGVNRLCSDCEPQRSTTHGEA